jgi:8-amino-7-oxononanoate synthase
VSWLSSLERAAAERERAGLRRELRARAGDDGLVDLAGNDYLGLSRHPEVVSAATAALKAYGLGATASRLVRGSTDVHRALETALAGFLGCEAALVFSSGYLANLGGVRALAPPGTLLASDAHNHASLVDGCRLASVGRGGVRVIVFGHADPSALEAALASPPARGADAAPSGALNHPHDLRRGAARSGALDHSRRGEPNSAVEGADRDAPAVAITESVFSVHGDLAPLARLHAVARRHGAVLLVDDAHGVGVVGAGGAGAVVAAGLGGAPDVVVTATLSKAFGAAGGIVAGPEVFIRHLVETSRTFIYDTALPPAVAAGALAALELIRGEAGEEARLELAGRAAAACRRLRSAGLDVSAPAGGVLSVGAPGPEEAVAWATRCRARGVAVGCFRPPSTPDGESRLRLTINTGVTRDDFDRALEIILAAAP